MFAVGQAQLNNSIELGFVPGFGSNIIEFESDKLIFNQSSSNSRAVCLVYSLINKWANNSWILITIA